MNWRPVIIFIAGLVVGGVSGYFIAKEKYETLDISVDEIDDPVAYLPDFGDETESEETEVSNVDDVVVAVAEGSATDRINRLKDAILEREEYGKNTLRTRYDRISAGLDTAPEEEGEIVYDSDGKEAEPGEIHVIDPADFGEKYSYDKVTLYFWEQNNMLTDTDGYILDVPPTIGFEAIGRFGEFDPDIVYVRNDKTSTYYDVQLMHEDYYNREPQEE